MTHIVSKYLRAVKLLFVYFCLFVTARNEREEVRYYADEMSLMPVLEGWLLENCRFFCG
jgi:hypothetical protein